MIDTDAVRLTACCGGQGEEMADELDRLRDALETIADGRMCTAVVDNAPPSSWCRNDPGRSRDSRYGATRWCDACIARDALGYGR